MVKVKGADMADYEKLERNISDTIYEGIMKIGFAENEPMKIYYDLGLLCQLLDCEEDADLKVLFPEFKKEVEPRLGTLIIKRIKGRFEFTVLGEGVRYIYENNSRRHFLKELIQALEKKDCTMEQILPIFRKESEDLTILEEDQGEFQYVVYFNDSSIDEFKYCFTFDEMGHYYHRLLDYDYHKL